MSRTKHKIGRNKLLPCPFCAGNCISVMQDTVKEGVLTGVLFHSCFCAFCGAHGPTSFNVGDEARIVIERCMARWNERDGIKQEDKNEQNEKKGH